MLEPPVTNETDRTLHLLYSPTKRVMPSGDSATLWGSLPLPPLSPPPPSPFPPSSFPPSSLPSLPLPSLLSSLPPPPSLLSSLPPPFPLTSPPLPAPFAVLLLVPWPSLALVVICPVFRLPHLVSSADERSRKRAGEEQEGREGEGHNTEEEEEEEVRTGKTMQQEECFRDHVMSCRDQMNIWCLFVRNLSKTEVL
eukprot:337362-Hanusia_phi.AAC.1